MRAIKNLGLLVLALAGSILFWSLGYAAGLPVLLFGLSLAVVGKGNRLLWPFALPFACCLIGALAYAVYSVIPPSAELAKLLFATIPLSVVPGVVLWLALRLKRSRQMPADAAHES